MHSDHSRYKLKILELGYARHGPKIRRLSEKCQILVAMNSDVPQRRVQKRVSVVNAPGKHFH